MHPLYSLQGSTAAIIRSNFISNSINDKPTVSLVMTQLCVGGIELDSLDEVKKTIYNKVLETYTKEACNTFNINTYPKTNDSIEKLENALSVYINIKNSKVALKTRRGIGNTIILSDYALSLLSKSKTFYPIEHIKMDDTITYVGTFNTYGSIYVDSTFTEDSPLIISYHGEFTTDYGPIVREKNNKYYLHFDDEQSLNYFELLYIEE